MQARTGPGPVRDSFDIINSTYITLDGVIQDPQDWPDNGIEPDGTGQKVQTDLLFGCDAMLMGGRTYPPMAAAWMARSGDPFSDRINSMAKYVVSGTLTDPQWPNTTVIGADPIAAIRRLKDQPGQDIVQYGFGQLSYALLEHGLLDELRLWVHPLFAGRATAEDLMFRPAGRGGGLWPVASEQTGSLLLIGVVAVRSREPLRMPARTAVLPVLVGAGGMTATLLYFYATHFAMLATAAVLVSLYPGVTVLLARMLLHERFSPVQRAGLGLCSLAVIAIALN